MNGLPEIEEDLNFEKILSEKLRNFTASYQTQVPSFQAPTAIDPVYSVFVELSMTELMIRARINEAALSFLLQYSKDLDFLLFGVRRDNESLEAFRERIRLNLHMASPAGSLEMYRSLALSSANEGAATLESFAVLDARAEVAQEKIVVYLQPNLKVGPAMTEVVKRVTTFLNREDIKPAFDIVEVKEAQAKKININAKVKLSAGNGAAFLEKLKLSLSDSVRKISRLGTGLPISWIYSQLHVLGVQSATIVTPIADVPVGPNEFISLGVLILTEDPA